MTVESLHLHTILAGELHPGDHFIEWDAEDRAPRQVVHYIEKCASSSYKIHVNGNKCYDANMHVRRQQ